MIPYFKPPSYELGPFPIVGSLTLEVFGVFVVLGIFLGARLAYREAESRGLDSNPLADYALWGVGAGIVMGHFVHLFGYHPEELTKNSWQILRVWDGLSSFGGLLGAILAAVVYFRLKGVSFASYGDAFALGTAPGWAVARIGCFLVHDHPGVRTDFPLSVNFPAGYYGLAGPRHDLGLDDALVLGALTAILFLLRRRDLLRGRLLPLLALLYAVPRFFLDFLRATDLPYVDKRYGGLTPAQYGCFLLVAFGVYGLARWRPPARA